MHPTQRSRPVRVAELEYLRQEDRSLPQRKAPGRRDHPKRSIRVQIIWTHGVPPPRLDARQTDLQSGREFGGSIRRTYRLPFRSWGIATCFCKTINTGE